MGNQLDHGVYTAVNTLADMQFGVVELRRYVMRPGRRDDLIALFEREFIESQEACGMTPIGHYRDLDDAESYVWFRGFSDMESRRSALEAFYVQSPAWLNNRDAANDTLVDSDNVLLLRPARPDSGFDLRGLSRPQAAPARRNGSLVGVAVLMLNAPAGEACIASFEDELLPRLKRDAQRVAYFVTEEHPNTFPRLPVREGEWAFLVTGICAGPEALNEWLSAFDMRKLPEAMRAQSISCETLRLRPADRALFADPNMPSL